jgi:uncharacterized protein YkwD
VPTPTNSPDTRASPTVTRRLAGTLAALLLATSALLIPALPAAAAPADDIHALADQARAANGQGPLSRNGALDAVAAQWAQQLAASGVLAHNPSYSDQIPGGWSRAGENVARGQADANQMHTEWMNSPGHRANILGDYTDIGVAFLVAGGTTWGVQVFANYPPAAAPAPAAPAPVAAVAEADSAAELETLSVPEVTAEATATLELAPASPLSGSRATVGTGALPGWSPLALVVAGLLLVAGTTAAVLLRRRQRDVR